MADDTELGAETARLKRAFDRQAVMAILGLVVVGAFFVIQPGDGARTAEIALDVLPWLVGLAALVLAANRITLSIQTKAVRARLGDGRRDRRA